MKQRILAYIFGGAGLLAAAILIIVLVIVPALGKGAAPVDPTPLQTQTRVSSPSPSPSPAALPLSGLHVSGNRLINAQGQTVILHGVNRSGTEYACLNGSDIFNGPSDAASVQAMKSWNINAVRIPLNEDCWLGINGIDPSVGGANYQNAIMQYVQLLKRNNIYAILDLHWAAPGTTLSAKQFPMPDADHAPAFWQSVASIFKNDTTVLFDLFNEPYPDHVMPDAAAWKCWRDGGQCPGISYTTAGYQQLVSVVRAAGAKNVIMLAGLAYAASLSDWLAYEPVDPLHNLAASWHMYNSSFCHETSCWNQFVAPVMQRVPLIAGEIGELDCNDTFVLSLMNWLDQYHASYLAWEWTTADCAEGPSLITSYDGTPTPYGIGVRDHFRAVAK